MLEVGNGDASNSSVGDGEIVDVSVIGIRKDTSEENAILADDQGKDATYTSLIGSACRLVLCLDTNLGGLTMSMRLMLITPRSSPEPWAT